MPSRRDFITGAAAAIGVGALALAGAPFVHTKRKAREISGSFVNDGFSLGHKLRDQMSGGSAFPAAKEQVRVPVVIVGGGIAGLSAAWWLDRNGFKDFVLLEMEREAGGNSRSGQNEISAYPWAAHYLPVPNKKAVYVRELCTELGLLNANGEWDERHLCHTPQERLFAHGRWQEGLEPHVGVTQADHDQWKRFEERIAQLRATGFFTIPAEEGFRRAPADIRGLDKISFKSWLYKEGFTTGLVHWEANYATRDDYGAAYNETSAYAGIHYFASREHEEKGPLTWPEGNGWIVKKLMAKLGSYVRIGAPVHRVTEKNGKRHVFSGDKEFIAEKVIWAAPTFLAPYVVEGMQPLRTFEYSPWVTANLTLDQLPRERHAELAWDNVIYDSASLGYVNANHQNITTHKEGAVFTWYNALVNDAPAKNRKMLLETPWSMWREAILSDLQRAHADIRDCVKHIDVMRLGHAMIRPTVGFIFGEERQRIARLQRGSNLLFANSDLSGISIFEEAQYRGVEAARSVLTS